MARLQDHRGRAERCFALARSTTFAGERDAAIARGLAIVNGHGFDPDDFDIPGRVRGGLADDRFGRSRGHHISQRSSLYHYQPPSGRAPDDYSVDEVRDLMGSFRRHMRSEGMI